METEKETKRALEKEAASMDLRSEEFQEVLGAVPPWILRWGIATVAAVVVLLIAGSALFRYPDVVTATVTLTGSRPAATVVAHSTGKLQYIYVEDNQPVEAGDYLALIENEAKAEDVRYLRNFLEEQAAVDALVPENRAKAGAYFRRSLRRNVKSGVLFTMCQDLGSFFEGDTMVLVTDSDTIFRRLQAPDNAKAVQAALESIGIRAYDVRMRGARVDPVQQGIDALKKNFPAAPFEVK